jgi:hypothetical protein
MRDVKGPASGVNLLIFVAAALACALAANHKCDFVKIYSTRDPDDLVMVRGIWRGMWNVTSDECTNYRDGNFEIDRHWNSARAVSIVADVLAGLALLMSCAAAAPQGRNKATAGSNSSLMLLACVFQGLTLLFLTSSACLSKTGIQPQFTKCEISQAGNLSIAATVLMFASALAACCMGAAVAMTEKEDGGDVVPSGGDDEKEGEDVGEEAPKEVEVKEGAV